jgi:16S rRNA (uracil1498-N3)-methyltransferase
MELVPPITLAELIEARVGESNLVARLGARHGLLSPVKQNQLLLVGPEGGLSEAEQNALSNADWTQVGFGEHVLRADTAVVVGAAILLARSAGTSVC